MLTPSVVQHIATLRVVESFADLCGRPRRRRSTILDHGRCNRPRRRRSAIFCRPWRRTATRPPRTNQNAEQQTNDEAHNVQRKADQPKLEVGHLAARQGARGEQLHSCLKGNLSVNGYGVLGFGAHPPK